MFRRALVNIAMWLKFGLKIGRKSNFKRYRKLRVLTLTGIKDSLHTWNAKISKKSFLRSSDSKFYMLSKNIIDVEELNINYGLNPL